ncbi:hypothetical protein [Arthrobacter sp. IK3]|uniref:hypothetical protein n=1 Tax=Arthrobacter sp. IK3 TaxID=3448169 RepID=UPI003EE2C943
MTILSLIEGAGLNSEAETEDAEFSGVTFCSCGRALRPEGADASQYPGTAPNWGNCLCRICDYEAAGKDPEDRFISQGRIAYLNGLRNDIESGRRSRGVPAAGRIPAGRMPIASLISAIETKGVRS